MPRSYVSAEVHSAIYASRQRPHRTTWGGSDIGERDVE